MNLRRHSWLAIAIAATFTVSGAVSATSVSTAYNVDTCQSSKFVFRTTHWLNPFDLNVSITDAAGAVTFGAVKASLNPDKSPATVLLPVEGGVLSKNLEIEPGFKIKKVLVCAKSPIPQSLPIATPLAGLTVGLRQSFPVSTVFPLTFEHMATSAPGCAVYRVAGNADELGSIGIPVDPRVSPTSLIISVPAGTQAEISGIGLRLQANPNSPLWSFVPAHQHAYLTGRGVGHNNTQALTSNPYDECVINPVVFSDDIDDTTDFVPDLSSVIPVDQGKGGKAKGKGNSKK